MIEPISPIFVTDLFPEMHAELFRVLESLTPDQWILPTACEGWSVKDVAQHLLADQCGYLSGSRDHEGVWFDTNSWDELITLINEQNEG